MATWCSGLFWAVGCPTIFSTMDLVLIDICVQTPRDCGDYLSEFRHCKSLWNRFHHYYAYGTIPSCHQWKEDYNNCKEWEKHKTLKAKVDTGTLLCFHTQKYYFILCIPSSWADCISDFYHLLDRMWKRQCNILNTVIPIFWHYCKITFAFITFCRMPCRWVREIEWKSKESSHQYGRWGKTPPVTGTCH